jgi:hypothetical protein
VFPPIEGGLFKSLSGHFGINEMAPELGEYEGMYPLVFN